MKIHYYKDDIKNICKDKHLTVEEIFEEISKIYSDAWKSSIYRNVEEMVRAWDLNKLVWIGKKSYFEANCCNHIHLVDKKTWKITDFNLCDSFKIPWLPENFNISDMDIKIFWEFNK